MITPVTDPVERQENFEAGEVEALLSRADRSAQEFICQEYDADIFAPDHPAFPTVLLLSGLALIALRAGVKLNPDDLEVKYGLR